MKASEVPKRNCRVMRINTKIDKTKKKNGKRDKQTKTS
jgi:hypothetical protein